MRISNLIEKPSALTIISICFLLTLTQFLTYGILFGNWLSYFCGATAWTSPLAYDAISSNEKGHITQLLIWLSHLNIYIFKFPILFLTVSYLIRFINLLLLYYFISLFLTSPISLLTLVFISFANATIGVGNENLTGVFWYFQGSYAITLLLMALIAIKHDKWTLAGLLMGIGTLIEAPTAVSYFIVVSFGTLIYFLRTKQQYRKFFVFIASFLLIFSTMLFPYFFQELQYQGVKLSISDWHHFLIVRGGAADTTITYSMNIYGLNVLALIACYFAFRTIYDKLLDSILLSTIIIYLFVLVIEILAAQGIFIPYVTPNIFSVELVRAFPLFTLTTALLIGINLEKNAQQSSAFKAIYIVALLTTLFIYFTSPTLLNKYTSFFLFVLATLLIVIRQPRHVFLYFIGFSIGLLIYYYLPTYAPEVTSKNLPAIISFSVLLLIFAISFTLLFTKFIELTTLISIAATVIVLTNLIHQHYLPSHLVLLKNHWQRVDQESLLKIMDLRRPDGKLKWAKYYFDNERDEFINSLKWLGQQKLPYGRVLTYPGYSIQPQFYTHLPRYILEYHDRGYSDFSLSYASDYDMRLKKVFGQNRGMAWVYQGNGIYDANGYTQRMQTAFSLLDKQQLLTMGQEIGIRYIVTRTRYSGWTPLYQNSLFIIYQIPVSSEWEQRYRAY